MPTKAKPAYTLHKATGQARVRIDGKDHYLGPYGSPESRERYDDLIAEWFAKSGDVSGYTLRIDDLALLYSRHADTYYRRNGQPTGEAANIRRALRELVRLYGTIRVRDFRPTMLKAVQEAFIETGRVRSQINLHVGRIRRMFKWGVANEYVPIGVYQALTTLDGLRQGRSNAKEGAPIKPVPKAHIDAIRPYVARQVWAMVELQCLTGARVTEILTMRGCDLNTTGRIWEYTPESHKTEHHGKQRLIFIGPKARAVVEEFLKPDTQAFLFSPADAVAEQQREKRARRKTPVQPSQLDRSRRNPQRKAGDRYTRNAYRRAIQRACEKAGAPEWHPSRLRHNAATELRRQFGIEAARTVLGHASAVTTEIYAEMDHAKARDIIGRIG